MQIKTDWNDWGLNKPWHDEAQKALDAILSITQNEYVITCICKEAHHILAIERWRRDNG